ncbi:MAG: BRCT domain-containing protein [Candidatus Omnitrophica bacterium]|nr:BRCT domain-containing protein [Candidatus Omnitrophota bacterium]
MPEHPPSTLLDANGQPLNRAFNASRLNDRMIDELIGIVKGIEADKLVNQAEAEFLLEWLTHNKKLSNSWPANVLYQRIKTMLKDKILDEKEKVELFDTLRSITGRTPKKGFENTATRLPLTEPLPVVTFKDQDYCFTGRFVTGTREQCQSVVINKGGHAHNIPTLDTNYLVIGLIGSTDWIHSAYGRKIERAVEIQKQHSIKIISEEYWVKFI